MHPRIPIPETPPRFSPLSTTDKVAALAAFLREKKAAELLALDLSGELYLCEAAILVTASSPRHAQGLADLLLEECRRENFEFLRLEGYASAQWILLDLNDVVVHIFQAPARDFYRLDDLWPSVPILADDRENQKDPPP
ncbi:MAG: ribosome silencing factor [Desulfovibrio sp.]|jgi:ribosome-associated protein|nr:ribosome silencing factor [Desulfovibrio sp.]